MRLLGPILLNILVAVVFLVYFIRNRKDAINALNISWASFKSIAPLIALVMILITFFQGAVSTSLITEYLSRFSGFLGYVVASLMGAIFHVPHFIAFPIGGELLQKGFNPGVIGAFITSLVMVHTFSIPVEIKELGLKFALVRNLLGIVFSVAIGFGIGVLY